MALTKGKWGRIAQGVKIAALVVIAAALVKFAFFPAGQGDDATDSLTPSADFALTTVTPQKGNIVSTLRLSGTIVQDPAQPVQTGLGGTLVKLYVTNGQQVNAGDGLGVMEKEMPGQEITRTDEDGNTIREAGPSWKKQEVLVAPVTGAVKLSALVSQEFSVGDAVMSVQPPTFSAQAQVSPAQMYRVQNVPPTAEVTIKDGPAPFACTSLTILAGTQQASPSGAKQGKDNTAAAGENDSSIIASCKIPAEQRVFAGLQVKLTVVGGEVKDVLTLPVTAVEGRFQQGYVFAPAKTSKKTKNGKEPAPKKIPVQLGMTDGNTIEIKSGITEKQQVLEYVPVNGGAMKCDPVTGKGC